MKERSCAAALVLGAALLLAACGEKVGGGHDHGAAAAAGTGAADHHAAALEKLTQFTERSEMFVEFAPLVVGRTSDLVAYATRLADYKPLARGRLTVLLSGGDGPDERFAVDVSAAPGVFRLAVTPKIGGERELTLIVESAEAAGTAGTAQAPGLAAVAQPRASAASVPPEASAASVVPRPGTLTHEFGPITVFADARAAKVEQGGGEGAIRFAKEQQWKIDFATAEAVRGTVRTSVTATGEIKARPDGEALLVAPAAGILRPAGAFPRIGQFVVAGQVLATLSPRLGGETDQATLDAGAGKARIGFELARRERERMESLFKDEAIPEKRLFEARANEAIARTELDAAQARAAQLGGGVQVAGKIAASSATSSATANSSAAGTAGQTAGKFAGPTAGPSATPAPGQFSGPAVGSGGITLRSPIAGTIAAVSVTPGAFVGEGAPLFHLAHTGRLWLEAHVPESAIGGLGTPTGAAFTVDGFDRAFEINARNGRLIAVGGVVDAATRTVPVIFEFDNPLVSTPSAARPATPGAGALRLGMSARVQVFSGSGQAALLIPASAVQDESGTPVVYVQTGGDTFERRLVETGPRDGAGVAILAGLEPGQRVVSRGAYLIRLSTSKAGPAAHAH